MVVPGRQSAPVPVRQSPTTETFESVYEAHYADVVRYVLLLARGREDPEEIASEVFSRAYAAWRDGRGPAGRALPWLLLIARRLVTDRWRRNRLIRWLPLPSRAGAAEDRRFHGPEPVDPGTTLETREFWMWLDALAEVLPERQREVLLLRYQRDLGDDEIGEILGLSASGVRSLASRALTALRRHPELWS